MKKVNVLIVEDSISMQTLMRRALEEDPEISVMKVVGNGSDAVDEVERLRPDVVTMDIMMPGMNGLDATRLIMQHTPTPIVIVSSVDNIKEQSDSFDAIEVGAVWAMSKPLPQVTDWNKWSSDLRKIVKAMAEVKVISRSSSCAQKKEETHSAPERTIPSDVPKIIVIAASTGGPSALVGIFKLLPEDFCLPILLCQHISKGFVYGFAEWLQRTVNLPVRVGKADQRIERGITVAPDSAHMVVASSGMIGLSPAENYHVQVPSADVLFKSAAIYYGPQAAGIILTGMGKDGAKGIGELSKTGALTIAQSKQSALVYGMPGAAKDMGYIKYEMTLYEIGMLLKKFHRLASKTN